MPKTIRSDEEWHRLIQEARQAILSGEIQPTFLAIADYLEINYRTIQSAFNLRGFGIEEIKSLAPPIDDNPEDEIGPVSQKKTQNNWEIDSIHPMIRSVEQLLDYCGVDLEVWMVDGDPGRGPVLNAWPTTAKKKAVDLTYKTHVDEKGNVKTIKEGTVQSDGELVSMTNLQIKVRLRRIKPVAVIPVIQPVMLGEGFKTPAGKRAKKKVMRTLLIADPHFGLSRNVHTGELTPIHDRRVLDIALQIAQETDVDDITFLGDLLDLSEWSTHWVTTPEFYWTTQPALIEAHWWLRQFREAQPGAVIDNIEGNHNRFKSAIIARLMAAYELRAVDELTMDPAISLPKLLALHELGIGFIDGYEKGDAEKWFSDSIVATHSDKASNLPGASARKIAEEVMFTTIFGHIHRRELISKKIETRHGPITLTAVCPGTASRVDAAVPGNKKRQQWQQGFALMDYSPDDIAPPRFDLVEVLDGQAIFDGQVWTARELDAQMEGYLKRELGKIGVPAE